MVSNPTQSSVEPLVNSFSQFGVDDQLALLWYVYEKMKEGGSVTPAAPGAGAAATGIAEGLFNQVKEKSHEEQLQIMRDLAGGNNTQITREYGSLSRHTKLDFWYLLAQGMDDGTIIPMPEDYQAAGATQQWLGELQGQDFEQQITILRYIADKMGSAPAAGSAI